MGVAGLHRRDGAAGVGIRTDALFRHAGRRSLARLDGTLDDGEPGFRIRGDAGERPQPARVVGGDEEPGAHERGRARECDAGGTVGRDEEPRGDDVDAAHLEIVDEVAEVGVDPFDAVDARPSQCTPQDLGRFAGDLAPLVEIGEGRLDRVTRPQRQSALDAVGRVGGVHVEARECEQRRTRRDDAGGPAVGMSHPCDPCVPEQFFIYHGRGGSGLLAPTPSGLVEPAAPGLAGRCRAGRTLPRPGGGGAAWIRRRDLVSMFLIQ